MPNTPSNYYISNNSSQLIFSETFDEKVSFGSISDVNLLFNIFSRIGQKELPSKLHITLQEGFHDDAKKKGFSAQHIFSRGHMKKISTYYKKAKDYFWKKQPLDDSDRYMHLIKIVNMAFSNINTLNSNDPDRLIMWRKKKHALIFAINTGIDFDGLKHLLIVLYPSDKDKLTIVTLYLIKADKFNKIRLNSANRYQNIFDTPSPLVNNRIDHPLNDVAITDKKYLKDEEKNESDDEDESEDIEESAESYEDLVYKAILPINQDIFHKDLRQHLIKQINFLDKEIAFRKEIYRRAIDHGNSVFKISLEMNKILNELALLKLDFANDIALAKIEVDSIFEKYINVAKQVRKNHPDIVRINLDLAGQTSNLELNFISLEKSDNKNLLDCDFERGFSQNIKSLLDLADQDSDQYSVLRKNLFETYEKWVGIKNNSIKITAVVQGSYNAFFEARSKAAMRALYVVNQFISFSLKNDIGDIALYMNFLNFIGLIIDNTETMQVAAEETNNSNVLQFFESKVEEFKKKYDIKYNYDPLPAKDEFTLEM